ncbi:proteasome accessory factor PafA2 family protein [Rubripirellula reticaptiva]|uniref:Pup--protein ligase n=1 Tax=Rubripirellula reticaptiva TaxID=2528013 RepID=A0A5C6EWW0_9BACT|nr:proteasome accessory factor PafA2 family protein [Rubripirellula reticaptiva]TWU51949.1 Pup--protein ligase [Rubripirellula reticaptiva]
MKRAPKVRLRRNSPLVTRLVGLETEYATLVADNQNLTQADLPPSQLVYSQICEAIRRDQPTVSGLFDSEQMFLASGGAVTFESHPSMYALPGGLVEIATPEVQSPDDLLACQRSIDELASDATADSETSFDLRILKNSSDALGHVYGCHENYEAEVASGIGLVVYRAFVLLMWGMQVISLMCSLPLMMLTFSAVSISRILSRQESSHEENEPHDIFELVPTWISTLLVGGLRLVHLPTVMVLRFVARHVAFRVQRRYLSAMLVSRVAICGSGNLDPDSRFCLSAKAMAIDAVADMGGFRGERPIFVYGHWLGQYCAKSFLSLGSTRQMFNRRQRLQIGLSDSNMSDLAEYVKVGSVSLVLDMLEAGETTGLPVLNRPIESLKRIASDWNLVSRVPTNRGEMSAIEIQREFLHAAEAFVDATPANMRGEAPLVVYRWRELLDSVTAFRKDFHDIEMGLGRVDWMTKRWLMDQLGDDKPWAAKKKIDLRYHELSPDGYYVQFIATRPDLRLVDDDNIARRRKSPPASSPAARRGWLIREFADSDELLQSEWTYAMIGRGRRKRRVDFSGQ